MNKQEQDYLNTFTQLLLENDTRYAASFPLWNIMEFGHWVAGAMISERETKAFTIAVEEMIEKHYNKQKENVNDDHKELKSTLMKLRDDK